MNHEKIRRLRREKDLTQQQAAKLAGMKSSQQWHAIESGKKIDVRVSTLEAIARALGVQPAELLK